MILTLFLLSIGLILYTLVGYPLILLALWAVKGRRPVPEPAGPMRVSFLIPAHNEGAVIQDKLANTLALDNTAGHEVEIIVVSDGSNDDTVARAQSIDDPRIQVWETPGRLGKLEALNWAVPQLRGQIVIFSDANAILSPQALDSLTRHFSDPTVGGVCGQLTIETGGGGKIAEADNLFWRYDQAMKQAESDLGGVVSAQGSIYAIRHGLLSPIPDGVADDFLNSVRVVDQGQRLVFEPRATTRETVTEQVGSEMGRRIRSTEMGWRGLMMMRHLMNPFRTGLYGWQLASHKGLRRLIPVFLILAFITNMLLMGQGPVLSALGLLQILGYGLCALAAVVPAVRRLPLMGAALFFVMGNLAMLLGLLRVIMGRRTGVWTPVRDGPTP